MSMPDWVRRLFPAQAKEFEREDAPPTFTVVRTTRDGRIDAYSDTWIFVSNWAESELKNAREANDSQKRTETDTAALRGRIKLLKELMALPEPPRERQRQRPVLEEF